MLTSFTNDSIPDIVACTENSQQNYQTEDNTKNKVGRCVTSYIFIIFDDLKSCPQI